MITYPHFGSLAAASSDSYYKPGLTFREAGGLIILLGLDRSANLGRLLRLAVKLRLHDLGPNGTSFAIWLRYFLPVLLGFRLVAKVLPTFRSV